jgi:hypothetical protein
MSSTTTLLVRKNQLSETQLHTADAVPLADGQIRVHVDAFALTSNNITYAAFGDMMNYWQFFPTAKEGFGIIPVWGFGTVVQSLHAGVAVGERLYGYFPMACETILTPARLDSKGFYDAAAQRRELHPVYNQYLRCNTDPFYTPASESLQMLLRPLFMTSFLIDDFLADNDFFGAPQGAMLLSSASSKTAYGTAFQLAQRPGIEVIGLTSPGNVDFCESLGCYSRVLTYDQLDPVAADRDSIYIDFAGNASLRHAIHSRFTNLKYSCAIGGTHVTQLGGAKNLPGPPATLFFAPAQVKKRSADWGKEELGRRLVQAWQAFSARVAQEPRPWLQVQRHQGEAAVAAVYQQVLAGQGDPRTGHILAL